MNMLHQAAGRWGIAQSTFEFARQHDKAMCDDAESDAQYGEALALIVTVHCMSMDAEEREVWRRMLHLMIEDACRIKESDDE